MGALLARPRVDVRAQFHAPSSAQKTPGLPTEKHDPELHSCVAGSSKTECRIRKWTRRA